MSAVITPFEGTELFNTASFNNRISQINTGFSYISNPNLLDNWYFGNPVNQRGQTSYTDAGYGIDRWFMTSGALKIQNGIIELSGSSNGGAFEQKIENPKRFAGKTVTLSVLGKRSKSSWYIAVRQDGVYRDINMLITNSFACASVTFVADSTLSNELVINFACWDESDVAEIKAIKLELGSQQTLAHQDADGNWVLNEIPDYGEQLRRCQRYFWRLHSVARNNFAIFAYGMKQSDNQVRFVINFPATFRVSPVITANGKFLVSTGTEDYAVDSIDRQSFNGESIVLAPKSSTISALPNGIVMRFGAFNDSDAYIDFSADL